MKKSRKRRKIGLKLKKQTQFSEGQNERKTIYNKGIREIYWIEHLVKTNPIQSQTKPISFSPQACSGGLKKQSQFSNGQRDAKSVLIMVYGDFGE